ncbi:MAG TPA: hypothetical protein VNW29_00095 [Candidatus Sulfotelmatobacter sp.]|jgi:hypothetical protein|nr:hypothetical protein [Candidatus Sulfotelmatobacter sp.]
MNSESREYLNKGVLRKVEPQERDSSADLVAFIDRLCATPIPDLKSSISEDGGERLILIATPDGELFSDGEMLRRVSPGEEIGKNLIVGSEVYYGSPESSLRVTSYTDPKLRTPDQRDNRNKGRADYMTLIGAKGLLNEVNIDEIVARAVTLKYRRNGKDNREEYVIISQRGTHTVFKDTRRESIFEHLLIKDAVGERKHVTLLPPAETTIAFSRIGDAYKSTVDVIHQGYRQVFRNRFKNLP